jgi:sugar/nucleoside kinase (ribokinase family)
VLKGLAGLAGGGASLAAAFVGMVGADEAGREYTAGLAAHGVQPLLLTSSSGAATATCLCLVTPDGQRTMRTALCAALELSDPTQLPAMLTDTGAGRAATQQGNEGMPQGSTSGGAGATGDAPGSSSAGAPLALLHCEGYCLYRSAVAAAAMRAARARAARVSLDLASFEVVGRCWAQLNDLLQVGSCLWVAVCSPHEQDAIVRPWVAMLLFSRCLQVQFCWCAHATVSRSALPILLWICRNAW